MNILHTAAVIMMTFFISSCGQNETPVTVDPAPVIAGSGAGIDLAAGLTANANQVPTGTPVSYTITLANNPSSNPAAANTATNVQAVLSLPASNVTFVSADAGCFPTNNTVVCYMYHLQSGDSSSRVVTVTPTQAGSLQAQVTVSAKETDINIANNQASLAITVTGPR